MVDLYVNGDHAAAFDTYPYFIEELTAGWLFANERIENGYELPQVDFADGRIHATVVPNDMGIMPSAGAELCLSDAKGWLDGLRRRGEGAAGYVGGRCVAFYPGDGYCALLRVIGKRVLKPAGLGDLIPVVAHDITEAMARACILSGIPAIVGQSTSADGFAQDNGLLIIP